MTTTKCLRTHSESLFITLTIVWCVSDFVLLAGLNTAFLTSPSWIERLRLLSQYSLIVSSFSSSVIFIGFSTFLKLDSTCCRVELLYIFITFRALQAADCAYGLLLTAEVYCYLFINNVNAVLIFECHFISRFLLLWL